MIETTTLPPLGKIPDGEVIPLSYTQRRLWFLDRLQGNASAYSMYTALRLEGRLESKSLHRALATLVQRHNSLRMCFRETGTEVRVQLLVPYDPLIIDDQSRSPQRQAKDLHRWLEQRVRTPFDLTNGPLFRVFLLRLTGTEQILLINAHPIVADDRSFGVMLRELSLLYGAYRDERDAGLVPLPMQYSDYSYWQYRCRDSETIQSQLKYWKHQLKDFPELLDLPTDRPRSAHQQFQAAKLVQPVESGLKNQLESLACRQDADLFMTLLCAFYILLYRYSGQNDLCIGSPAYNRYQRHTTGIIGPLANMLVLRCRFENHLSFIELLARVRCICLDAYTHRDLPFERLVEHLQARRTLSHNAIFQIVFLLRNGPTNALRLPNLISEHLETTNTIGPLDLSLVIEQSACALSCTWIYNRSLFDEARIRRMSGHYEQLLNGIAQNPDQAVMTLPMLSTTERNLFLARNTSDTDFTQDKTVVDLFEAQVKKTPERTAVTFEGESLSYRELTRMANRVGHWLRSAIKRGHQPTGICMERSVQMIAALLGALKAGCAYLPLDPDYPKDRLAFMLEDSGVSVLITQRSLVARLPTHNLATVCFDASAKPFQDQPDRNLPRCAISDDLAYIIYTSGSTGLPKGVMINHRSLAASTLARIHHYRTAPESFLLLSSLSFDSSVAGIFWTLCTGGRLVLPQQSQQRDMQYLLALIEAQRISHILCIPSLYTLLLEQTRASQHDALSCVIVAGERVAQNLVKMHFQKRPQTQLFNEYGPTEATVWATAYAFKNTTREQPVLIGRPLAHTRIHILDANRQPVPVGVTGEIYISGAGLAQGYLNRPELTKERFIHITLDGSTMRVYKTGDLACWCADGNIEYRGRDDFQIKLRGYRIELGEIESSLMRHPTVHAAVAMPHGDDGKMTLIAYVVAQEAQPNNAAQELAGQLRDHLESTLPAYMIPNRIIMLDDLPLTANGKLDRAALPTLEATRATRRLSIPRDDTELKLIEIWETVLRIHPVGLEENFFELGGDSLLAVRLMSAIQQSLGLRLPLATLFQGPTVARLAAIIRERGESQPWCPLVPMRSKGSKPPLFCLPGAGGNVLYFHALSSRLDPEQPVYGLQTPGLDGKSKPHTHIEDLAANHIATMRSVQPGGPYRLCGHSFGAHVAFEISQQLLTSGETVALLAIFDTPAPGAADLEWPSWIWDDADWLILIAEIAGELLDKDIGVDGLALRRLPADERLRLLNERLQHAGWLTPGADLDPLRGLIQVYKTNVQTRYQPKNTHPLRITLFKAVQSHWSAGGQTLGWQRYASGPVAVHTAPGGHISMLTAPQVKTLAKKLTVCIAKSH